MLALTLGNELCAALQFRNVAQVNRPNTTEKMVPNHQSSFEMSESLSSKDT